MSPPPSGSAKPSAGFRSNRGWLLLRRGLLLGGALAVVGLFWFAIANRRPPSPTPPRPHNVASNALASQWNELRDVVISSPDSGEAWGRLGMLLLAHQYDQQTTLCFEQAARLDPREFLWPYLLGVHLAVSTPDAAAKRFRQAIAIRPHEAIAHLRLGELLLNRQQLSEAAPHLRRALELDAENPRVHLAMARLAMLSGDAQSALPWAEFAVRVAPDQRATHETLALVYQRTNRREQALQELALAEKLPEALLGWEDPYAQEVLAMTRQSGDAAEQAETLLALHRVDEAVAVLEQALKDERRDPALFCALARALLKQGRPDRSQETLLAAERQHPGSPEVQFQLGVLAFLKEDFSRAASRFQAAIHRKGDYALAHYNLGHALKQSQDSLGAVAAFEAALQFEPDYVPARINLAKLLLEKGKVKQASTQLRYAREQAPDNQEVLKLLQSMPPINYYPETKIK